MLDGMSDSVQGSRIKNLQSREVDRQSPTGLIFIIIIVLTKVTLIEICCRGTLQSQWSTLTDSTSHKAEESVNVTDESRSSWYSSWKGTGGSSDDGGRWRQTRRSAFICSVPASGLV